MALYGSHAKYTLYISMDSDAHAFGWTAVTRAYRSILQLIHAFAHNLRVQVLVVVHGQLEIIPLNTLIRIVFHVNYHPRSPQHRSRQIVLDVALPDVVPPTQQIGRQRVGRRLRLLADQFDSNRRHRQNERRRQTIHRLLIPCWHLLLRTLQYFWY